MAKGGKEIRRRIKSVKNTQQITKAMKMVAAARLRKSEGRTQASRPYSDTLRRVMQRLGDVTSGGSFEHPFLRHIAPDVPKVLAVLFTSDKGLCGSFNTNLVRKAEEFIRQQTQAGRQVELVLVGRKGYQYFKSRGLASGDYIASYTHKSSFADMKPLVNLLTSAYMGQQVSEVYLIYSRFVNVVKNIPSVVRLLPIEAPPQAEASSSGFREDVSLEPSPEALLEVLLPRYFQTVLFQAALENFTSENGSRMVAMENATKAAGDMIVDLTLQYNKARQAGITLELLDIVGGAEALKG
ncbi:ATP synthase F1 subunit gamma [bacterium]|nr:ATP synthase F1 subunit gamma [bacterium]